MQEKNRGGNCPCPEVDRPLGGGIVPGSVILWGGEPGIGKSTLVLQICGAVSRTGRSVLYISGEESEFQIKMRANRLGMDEEKCFILSSPDLSSAEEQIASLRPGLVVIDSIQTMYLSGLDSPPGKPCADSGVHPSSGPHCQTDGHRRYDYRPCNQRGKSGRTPHAGTYG